MVSVSAAPQSLEDGFQRTVSFVIYYLHITLYMCSLVYRATVRMGDVIIIRLPDICRRFSKMLLSYFDAQTLIS